MSKDYPYGRISKWVYESIKPSEEGHICFSEYVHMVGYFVMFAVKDLVKFLFSCTDDEGKQYIRFGSDSNRVHKRLCMIDCRRDQFNMLLDHLAQNSPFNVRVWKLQYEQYHGKCMLGPKATPTYFLLLFSQIRSSSLCS